MLVDESILFDARDLSFLAIPVVIPEAIWTVGLAGFVLLLAVYLAEVIVLLGLGRAGDIDALLAHHGFVEEAVEPASEDKEALA
jgi:hypothetical protein